VDILSVNKSVLWQCIKKQIFNFNVQLGYVVDNSIKKQQMFYSRPFSSWRVFARNIKSYCIIWEVSRKFAAVYLNALCDNILPNALMQKTFVKITLLKELNLGGLCWNFRDVLFLISTRPREMLQYHSNLLASL
jgi:hypothetical protein